jgi:CRP/FNR family nitrogen fixation transcriptional regulator
MLAHVTARAPIPPYRRNCGPSGGHSSTTSAPAPFLHPGQPATVYAANTEIFAQGEKVSAIYQVAFGAIRIYRLLADGRRQISAFHFSGETFGLESGDRHEFFAEAITNAGIRIIRPSANGGFADHLLPIALQGLARAQRHLLLLGRQTALEKLAAFLTDMAERQGDGDHVDLPMQRGDIGDYLGLTLETVSRIFSKLKEAGIIRMRTARSIEIVEMAALKAMSE